MERATDKLRIEPELLTAEEIGILRAGDSPWKHTSAPIRPNASEKHRIKALQTLATP